MDKKVLVIGAGAAGLMAGSELAVKGFRVTILEARNRTGGRIHTINNVFSRPVETGAEFIHGEQPVTMSIAQKSNARLSRMAGSHYRIAHGELERSDFFNDQWSEMLNELQKLKSDMPMGAFLEQHFNRDRHQELYASVKGFVEGFDAADLDTVSAMALKEEWIETNDDEHQYHLDDGYAPLIHYLEEKIRSAGGSIILSAPVKQIQWSDESVKVLLSDDCAYTADKVIITVPLGVLQKGEILFSPAIPAYQRAFSNIGFGGVIKFLFEFRQAFWEDQTTRQFKDMAFIFSDAAIPTWWSQLPDKTPILTGWLGGPSTRSVIHTQEALYEKAIISLCYIFDCSSALLESQLKQWHIADWTQDQYSHGAYAYATVDSHEARKTLLTPVASTLYFAGEAIYEGAAMGTVEAAFVSGQKTAARIFEDSKISFTIE